jgi:DNA-binding transcriptional ArsR family regulator
MARAQASSDIFHVIADENRRRLIDALRHHEEPVGALVAATGLSYSSVSQHLGILLDAKVVASRAQGRKRFYRLHAARLREVHDWTSNYKTFWRARMLRLHAYLDDEQ